jgi:hypothetical protein
MRESIRAGTGREVVKPTALRRLPLSAFAGSNPALCISFLKVIKGLDCLIKIKYILKFEPFFFQHLLGYQIQ